MKIPESFKFEESDWIRCTIGGICKRLTFDHPTDKNRHYSARAYISEVKLDNMTEDETEKLKIKQRKKALGLLYKGYKELIKTGKIENAEKVGWS